MMGGLLTALAAVAMLGLPNVAFSQEAPKAAPAQAAEKPAKQLSVYRLEFAVREVEEGKRLNVRSYTMSAQDGDRASIRVGNRIPYVTGSLGAKGELASTQFQYYDVGINIDCRLHEREGYVLLDSVSIDISSVVKGDEGTSGTPNPVVRSARAQVDAAVTPGKPTMVTTLDDVSSNRRYEVEVTATKVK
jgi:type II secretory pathway component GspD/PulD (secretin)